MRGHYKTLTTPTAGPIALRTASGYRTYSHFLFYYAKIDAVSNLQFLDLGDESRVSGDGKFFGKLDHAVMLSATELPSSHPFPFGNGYETSIYVSS